MPIKDSLFQSHSLQTTLDGKPFAFESLLFLPADYSDTKESYPLILFLHGAGARGNDVRELTNHHLPVVIEDKPGFPAILIAPQCPKDGWWSGEMIDKLNELLTYAVETYRVDTNRIYLTGLSMGGHGTWNMLRKYPDWFAAFASVCGGKGDYGMEGFTHIPGWAFHGEDDQVVPVTNSIVVVDAFRKAGGKINFTVYPDKGHAAWSPTYDKPDIFIWLLGHNKSDPDYEYVMDDKTKEFFDLWTAGFDYAATQDATPFILGEKPGTIRIDRTNSADFDITEQISWDVSDAWTVSPSNATLLVPAGKAVSAEFTFTYIGGQHDINPLPTFRSELFCGDKSFKVFSDKLKIDDKAYFAKIAPVHRASKITVAPIIGDGIATNEWEGVSELAPLRHRDGKEPFPYPTHVNIAYDDNKLYIAFSVAEPNPKGLKHDKTERDSSAYKDDNFQFFIQPDLTSDTYYHTIVNSVGTIMDGKGHDRSWNSDIDVATETTEDSWGAELAISWSALGMSAPEPGSLIGFQFTCERKQDPSAEGQWNPAYGWAHQPNRFGRLLFTE